MKDLVAVVKATHSSPRVGKSGPSYYVKGNSGKGVTSQNKGQNPQAGQRGRIQMDNTNAGSVGGGAFKKRMPFIKRQRAVSKGECRSSPQALKRHSPNKQPQVEANIGVRSVTNEGVTDDDLVGKKRPAHMAVWEKLVGRANEENIFINGQPVTALLDTGSQVTHVSHDFCLANGIEVHPLTKLVNIEGTGGDSIEYIGCAEASLSLPIGVPNF